MKCPSCSKGVNDNVNKCPQCGFHLKLIGKKIKTLPRKSGWFIDAADLVDEKDTNQLFHTLIHFNEQTGIEFYIVTMPSSGQIKPAEYVFYFLNHYEIGGHSHRGLLLMLFAEQKTICCEVGYSLESIITDQAANDIITRDAIPLLKQKKYGQALSAAADLLIDIIKHGQSKFKRFIDGAANIFRARGA